MLLGRKMGCGTILLIGGAALAFMYFSGGGLQLAGGSGGGGSQAQSSGANVACDTAEEMFACQVLASTEQTWSKLFQQQGKRYTPTTLTFYDQSGQSGCGAAQAAMGPFYCPADQGVYLDTSFFREMSTRMGAKGDFAQAYVIAHEVGHHIQNLSGVADQVRNAQRTASKTEGNGLQVRMELQADCYAGVWAAQNASRMEAGDVEEGLNAAHAIGDDTLMRGAGQRPVESMFTHGSSEQRMAWLRKGMQTGDPASCDTFARGAVR
jgi:predicted metalloprotease